GGARLRDCSAANCLHNGAMLVLEYPAVDVPGQPRTAGYGLARDDEAPEMFQEAAELRIAGGICNAAMKSEILINRVLAALERAIVHAETIEDMADLGWRSAIRSEACRLDFDARAQLHDLEHLSHRG